LVLENKSSGIRRFLVGYRSKNKLYMALATLYYLICLLVFLNGFREGIALYLMLIPVPSFFAGIIDALKSKKAKCLIMTAAAFAIFIVGGLLMPDTRETLPELIDGVQNAQIESIEFADAEIKIDGLDKKYVPQINVYPKDADRSELRYKTSDKEIVKFKDGVVTSVSEGTAEIYVVDAISKTESARISVVVTDEKVKALKEKASEIVDIINETCAAVTPESEEAIKAARLAYDEADGEVKAYVKNYGVLLLAEQKLAVAKSAKAISDEINLIGEAVDDDMRSAVAKARSEYDAATDEEKALVTNSDVLIAAENRIAAFDAQAAAAQSSKESQTVSAAATTKAEEKTKAVSAVVPQSSEKGKTAVYDNPGQKNTDGVVLNTSTKKFHRANCNYVSKIAPKNYSTAGSRNEAINMGYEPCKKCEP